MRVTLTKFLSGKTDKTLLQLVRYTFVGGFAFIIDFSLLWFFTEICHLHYLISATLSFLAGLITNFILSTKWVFNNSKVANKKLEFLLFGLIGAVGLGLNDLFMWLLTEYGNAHYLVSKIGVVFVVYLWNFFARKYLLYKN
ncbi:GtrA family protein [Bacteroides sp. 214]|uniref:GtrA family protein n=1 Tax=Bacteroides sp. 214 TaxID=2302935 RepID=UPI0013D76BE5|nr:GtrA family protein [Bacteroides sp. 214]